MADDKNIKKDLLRIFGPTECISEEALLGYLHDDLTASDKQLVEGHLLDCPLCTDALQGISLMSEKDLKLRTRAIRERVTEQAGPPVAKVVRFRPWRIAAAAAILSAMVGFGWLFIEYLDQPTDTLAVNEPALDSTAVGDSVFKEYFEPFDDLASSGDSETEGLIPEVVDENPVDNARVDGKLEETEPVHYEPAPEPVPAGVEKELAFEDDEVAGTLSTVSDFDASVLTQADTMTTFSGSALGGSNAGTSYTWTQTEELKDQPTSTYELNEVEIVSQGRQAKSDAGQVRTSQSGNRDKKNVEPSRAEDPVVRQQLVDDGVGYYAENRLPEALTNFNEVLEVEPTNETALFYSSVTLIEQNQSSLAVRNLDVLLKNDKSAYYDSAQWYRALALLQQGKTRTAKKQLDQIIGTGSPYEEKAKEAIKGF